MDKKAIKDTIEKNEIFHKVSHIDREYVKDINVKSVFKGSYPEFELTNGRYTVEWTDLGEGIQGDYHSDDPHDIALLRFDVSFDGMGVDDGSYCTYMPVDTPEEILKEALEFIMSEIIDKDPDELKKILERLSWISPEWFKNEEDSEKEHEITIRFSGEYRISENGLTKEEAIKDAQEEWNIAKRKIENLKYENGIVVITNTEESESRRG